MTHTSKWRLSRWMGRRRILGTTTTEVVFFLLIGAVTIGYAVPNFKDFVINNRTISGTNLVVSALNFARSEAIKRGVPVSTCASLDYATCVDSGWHDGWMVFTDEPIAGIIDGSDEVLRKQPGVELDITLVGQTFIRFAPNGSLAGFYQDADEFEGLVEDSSQPSSFGTWVVHLLPINSAYANSSGSSGSSGSGGQGGGSVAQGGGGSSSSTLTFTVCPRTAGYKGRGIEISPTGRISTVIIDCTS